MIHSASNVVAFAAPVVLLLRFASIIRDISKCDNRTLLQTEVQRDCVIRQYNVWRAFFNKLQQVLTLNADGVNTKCDRR